MLNCPAYGQDKKTSFHLQQPYDKESKGKFLFEKEDNEEKKKKSLIQNLEDKKIENEHYPTPSVAVTSSSGSPF